MTTYIARRGDHLARIAAAHRLGSDEIWDHPDNAGLRERSPHVLAEGDVVHLPEPPPPARHRLKIGADNRIRGAFATIRVRVRVRIVDEVLAGEPCIVEGLPQPLETSTDGEGLLEFDAPVHLDEVVVRIPARHFDIAMRIGRLEPVEEERGVLARLQNLGYLLPRELGRTNAARFGRLSGGERRAYWMRRAIAAFQADAGMEVTGQMDDPTRAALVRAQGA